MAQQIKCLLLHKHGNLHLIESLQGTFLTLGLGRQKHMDLGPTWPVKLVKTVSSWFAGRPVSQQ